MYTEERERVRNYARSKKESEVNRGTVGHKSDWRLVSQKRWRPDVSWQIAKSTETCI